MTEQSAELDHDHSKCCRYNNCAHPACCGYRGEPGSQPGTEQIVPVRCYSCAHQFGAVPDRIDTTCPACGSDSFVQVRPRCIEDYVRVSDESGGTFTFCARCPRATTAGGGSDG